MTNTNAPSPPDPGDLRAYVRLVKACDEADFHLRHAITLRGPLVTTIVAAWRVVYGWLDSHLLPAPLLQASSAYEMALLAQAQLEELRTLVRQLSTVAEHDFRFDAFDSRPERLTEKALARYAAEIAKYVLSVKATIEPEPVEEPEEAPDAEPAEQGDAA